MTKFFLTFMAGSVSMGGGKMCGGVICVTILQLFHYFISLETANTQESEGFF